MNILRWRRKSKKKIKFKTIILFIFSLIMTTFAWYAYSKVLDPDLNFHITSWDMVYKINGEEQEGAIQIAIPTLQPAMSEKIITIDIFNNGETIVDIDYFVQSVSILGETYTLVREGDAIPEDTENYIILTDAYTETDRVTGKEIVRGAITNDIKRIPFTIEIEHSAIIEPKTTTSRIDETTGDVIVEETGGTGYLKIKVNWIGDNHELDTEWGYAVGDFFAENEEAIDDGDDDDEEEVTSAISITLAIDSYQLEQIINENTGEITLVEREETISMPSTSETKPYLPTGFIRVAGTTLENGLVIKDASGNEYVWVEVPKNTEVYPNAGLSITNFTDGECALIENDLKAYSEEYRTREDRYSSNRAIGLDSTSYNSLKNKMLKSIYQNGGFYIGRYETGIEGSYRTSYVITTEEVPVIKQNAYPYNYLTCSQAQTLATNMASGDKTSSLMFGLQWDLVLKYLYEKGAVDEEFLGNYNSSDYYVLNSKAKYSLTNLATWLNAPYEKSLSTSVGLTTGANTTFSYQNIYDLAGNVAEWTLNVDSADNSGGNGGDYSSSTSAVNSCGGYTATSGEREVGFRVTIY